MHRYFQGDLVPLQKTFFLANTPTDPTSVYLDIIPPDRTAISAYTYSGTQTFITRSGQGVYAASIAGSISGTYNVRWRSSGTVQDTEESQFAVRPTNF